MAIPRQDNNIILECSAGDCEKLNLFLIKIIELIKAGRRKIIIHFPQDIEFDSRHLKSLYRVLKLARRKLIDIKIVVPSKKMKDTFGLTRLGVYSGIYTSLPEAERHGFMPFVKYGTIACIAIFIILYAQVVRWLVFSWCIDPYYSHGALVLLVTLFLIWKRRSKMIITRSNFSFKTFFLITVALLFYLAGYFMGVAFFKGISLIFFLLGFIPLFYGKEIRKQIFLPIGILFFAVPIPRIEELASLLQHSTAGWVTFIASRFNVAAYNIGINIFLKNGSVAIDAPCSGLRSLIALLFVAAVFISFFKTPFYKKFFLFLTIAPVSIAANVARVTVLILLANRYGLKTAMFYFHYISGLLFFILALSILILEKAALKCDWEIN